MYTSCGVGPKWPIPTTYAISRGAHHFARAPRGVVCTIADGVCRSTPTMGHTTKAWSTPPATVHTKSGLYHKVMLFWHMLRLAHTALAHTHLAYAPLGNETSRCLSQAPRSGSYPRGLFRNQGLSLSLGRFPFIEVHTSPSRSVGPFTFD